MPRIAVFTVSLVVLAGLSTAADPAASGSSSQRLTLLHTSDLHGQVLPFDDARRVAVPGSLAQIATAVASIRASTTDPVLLLDTGDTIQGTPIEELSHVRWGLPSPTIAIMNRLGYAAMAVGNHEFNFGLEVLRRAEAQATFPFLCANAVHAQSGEPAFRPYEVFSLGQIKVGVLGLITPGVTGWEQREHYAGLRFDDMEEAARLWVPTLRKSEGCDLVVVLAHTGLEDGYDSTSGPDENAAERLVSIPGVDVLLIGHTHREIAPHLRNRVIVAQPGAHARALTRIDLEMVRQHGAWRLVSWQGETIHVALELPDPGILRELAPLHEKVQEALDVTVGSVSAAVSVARCRVADCEVLDLVHTVQLEESGADISLAAVLSDRTPDHAAGPMDMAWVWALYVYPNTLVKVEVSGREVKDILEHMATFYQGLTCDNHGCTVLTDGAIPTYQVDSAAGVSYRIDPTRAAGDRVRDLRFAGEALDPGQHFTLVCSNYRAAGGGGYPHLPDAKVLWTSSTPMTDLIADHLRRIAAWRPRVDGNWSIARDLVGERALPERP